MTIEKSTIKGPHGNKMEVVETKRDSSLKISELTEALEKATGPDRELDLQIHLPIGWSVPLNEKEIQFVRDHMEPTYNEGYYETPPRWVIPAYTASIDAAMTLYKSIPDRVPSNAIATCKEALQQWL